MKGPKNLCRIYALISDGVLYIFGICKVFTLALLFRWFGLMLRDGSVIFRAADNIGIAKSRRTMDYNLIRLRRFLHTGHRFLTLKYNLAL